MPEKLSIGDHVNFTCTSDNSVKAVGFITGLWPMQNTMGHGYIAMLDFGDGDKQSYHCLPHELNKIEKQEAAR